eukprot:3941893-Pleurochrysis_carterae.AAC.1
MLCNSLALVPCGRLDGGRAATACFGRRCAAAKRSVSALCSPTMHCPRVLETLPADCTRACQLSRAHHVCSVPSTCA